MCSGHGGKLGKRCTESIVPMKTIWARFAEFKFHRCSPFFESAYYLNIT